MDADKSPEHSSGVNKRVIILWASVIVLIAVIEVFVAFWFDPHPVDRTNFLKLTFAEGETVQRAIAYEKLKHLADRPADILQVGDSSGMHGVVPAIMEAELSGARYLNMSVATTLGYVGYYNIAKYVLDNQKQPRSIKNVVLYVSMIGGHPRSMLWDDDELIGQDVRKEFTSPFYRFFQLPSLGLRKDVSHNMMYMGENLKLYNAPLINNKGYLDFKSLFQISNGWIREHDVDGDIPADIWATLRMLQRGERPKHMGDDILRAFGDGIPHVQVEYFYDWPSFQYVSYLEMILGLFNDLAKKHEAKLFVVFNPLPQSSKQLANSEASDTIEDSLRFIHFMEVKEELQRLVKMFPEAYIQTEFDFWLDHHFSVFSHIGTPFATQSSLALAKRLKLNGLNVQHGNGTVYPPEALVDMTRSFAGYGWQHEGSEGSAVYWIGPRDAALAWVAVNRNGDYRLQIEVGEHKQGAFERLSLIVNDELAIKSQVDESGGFIEWDIPASAINKWNGWLMLAFTTRKNTNPNGFWMRNYPLSKGKSISIKNITVFQKNSKLKK